MDAETKTLVVIAGPTAVGKTALAIQLAEFLDTEIISADSRQFYREMSIDTAKPSDAELARVKHHFIGSHSIHDRFSVGDFEVSALKVIESLFRERSCVVMAGGSGLYLKAVCEGFDALPVAPAEIRAQLNTDFAKFGIGYLQKKLEQADPVYFGEVDVSNPQRLIRALEVFIASGKPFSSFRSHTKKARPFNIVKIALHKPRETLYANINARVDLMVENGLVEEARSLLEYRNLNALNTVGYAELFRFFDGEISLDYAIGLIKQNTRNFAKRQVTWLKKDQSYFWFENATLAALQSLLKT